MPKDFNDAYVTPFDDNHVLLHIKKESLTRILWLETAFAHLIFEKYEVDDFFVYKVTKLYHVTFDEVIKNLTAYRLFNYFEDYISGRLTDSKVNPESIFYVMSRVENKDIILISFLEILEKYINVLKQNNVNVRYIYLDARLPNFMKLGSEILFWDLWAYDDNVIYYP